MTERFVRVKISGPVLATLILGGWLELQGAPPLREAPASLESGGTFDLHSETAEYWVDIPCDLVYELTAASHARRGTLRRFGVPGRNGSHGATYLLRLEVSGEE